MLLKHWSELKLYKAMLKLSEYQLRLRLEQKE